MKTVVLRIFVVAAIALTLSLTALGQPNQAECSRAYTGCVGRCNRNRDAVLATNRERRREIAEQLTRDLNQCRIQNLGDRNAIETCRQEKRDDAARQQALLILSDRLAEQSRLRCITECRTQLAACPETGTITANAGELEVDIECIPGGAPCFKEVSKFCQQISGPCEACGISMCGGGEWGFDAEVPLVVTLAVGTDPLTNPRVLATSTLNGRQAVLNVPPDIKLGADERLYLSFSSAEKPGKPVKVAVRRNKK